MTLASNISAPSNVNICDLAMAIPTPFEISSFLIFKVLPVLCVIAFALALLFAKNKKVFTKKIILNPLFFIILAAFIFFYPKTYIQLRALDIEVIKKCDCLGIKSEVFGGNSICSGKQECLGVPQSCVVADERCEIINEGEITINGMRLYDREPFTDQMALDLVKESNISVEVVRISESLRLIEGNPGIRVSITYKVAKEDKEAFTRFITYLPIDREHISSDEQTVCEKTNL